MSNIGKTLITNYQQVVGVIFRETKSLVFVMVKDQSGIEHEERYFNSGGFWMRYGDGRRSSFYYIATPSELAKIEEKKKQIADANNTIAEISARIRASSSNAFLNHLLEEFEIPD